MANAFIALYHRHHPEVVGHKFSLGLMDEANAIRGVAIVGRPVARARDDGATLEVTRLATDGCPNGCSTLYGASWRAAKALGYSRIGTYTLASESGVSLRAAGWLPVHAVRGRAWDTPSRRRDSAHPTEAKRLWEPADCRRVPPLAENEADRLSRRLESTAERAAQFTKERDRLIGELHRRGLSLRQIARRAGLSHPAVRRTLIRDGLIQPPSN